MKKFIYILFLLLTFGFTYSQSPQKFTYQSIVRSADGRVLKSNPIGIRISILRGSNNGITAYSETHDASTNPNGLVTLIIGDGSTSQLFSEIDWSNGEYFLRVEIDPLGGIDYSIEQSSQLLSVPYALYAANASNVDLDKNVEGILPVSKGGTGSPTAPLVALITAPDASTARAILGVDASGTGGTTLVLKSVTDNYLTLEDSTSNDGEQELTAGTVPISLGGTGSTSKETARTALGLGSIATQNNDAIDVDGGSIDGTVIGASAASTGIFTSVNSGLIQSVGDTDIIIKTGNNTTGTITLANGADGDIKIIPNGTGKVTVGAITFPAGDGTSNQTLSTDGSGTLSWTDVQSLDAQLSDLAGLEVTDGNIIVGDGTNFVAESGAIARTSLGLGSIATQNNDAIDVDGGSIDGTVIGASAPSTGIFTSVNSGLIQSVGDTDIIIKTGNNTTGTITLADGADGDIKIIPNGTGKVTVGAIIFPAVDGTANQILKTDGSGNLSFTDQNDSTPVTLATVTDNYLTLSGQEITAGTVPVTLGGTGSATAPMVGVITAADAAAARTVLGVDASGTDSSTSVTLATVTDNYLTLDGQEITAGTVPVTLGGTGSTTAPMVGVITAADAAAARTAIGTGSIATQNSDAIDVDGGAIDGTVIGASAPSTGIFTSVNSGLIQSVGDTDIIIKTGNATTGTITLTDGADGDINISPNGTGKVVLDNLTFPSSDGSANQILKTDGSGTLGWIDNTVAVNTDGDGIEVGDGSGVGKIESKGNHDMTIRTGNAISGDITIVNGPDGDIKLSPNGAGRVVIDDLKFPASDGTANYLLKTDGSGNLSFAYNPSVATNTVASGDGSGAGFFKSTGDQDVTISTGSADTGSISITQGENGNINILPNGTGKVVLDNITFPASNGSLNQSLRIDNIGELIWVDIDAAGTDNSTAVTLATVTDNYLTLSGQEITAGTVPVALGGTGSATAPMVGVITAADAAAARTVLGVDASGTDSSTSVTLATVTDNYLTLSGQEITAGTVPVALGGTGSATAPMVGVITAADAAAARTAIGTGSIATQNSDAVNVDGGAIDGTVIGANTASSASFTTVTTSDNISLGGSNKELRFYEAANYIGFEAPALAANQIWILPNADGSANQVLKTDGSGTLSWTAMGSGGAIDGLSDAKSAGTNFTGSLFVGHSDTGTLDTATYNTALGLISLNSITTGDHNVAVGYDALTANDSGSNNTAIGNESLVGNTQGSRNTAVGYKAMYLNQTGERNAAFGYASGKSGSQNASFGAYGLTAVTGSNNTALGYYAGASSGSNNAITSGTDNVVIGHNAGVEEADAVNRIVIGKGASGLDDNTVTLGNGSITNWLPTDDNEVDLGSSTKEMKDIYVDGVAYTDALGFGTVAMTLPTADGSADQVLKTDGSGSLGWATVGGGGGSLTSKIGGTNFTNSLIVGHDTTGTLDAAEYNLALGTTALNAITSGDYNLALGYDALGVNNSGERNVALGYRVLQSNTTGSRNIAIGYEALKNSTTGGMNIAIGEASLDAYTGGDGRNVAIGVYAQSMLTSGDYNVSMGYGSMYYSTTARRNVSIGQSSMWYNRTGGWNVAIGESAMNSNHGSYNTAIGFEAMASNWSNGGTDGTNTMTRNVGVGYKAGHDITTGTDNVFIGYQAGDLLTTGDNNIIIGKDAAFSAVGVDSEIVIGSGATGNGTNTVTLGNSSITAIHAQVQSISALSDVRAKREIKDGKLGLDFINKLRTVSYKLKNPADYPSEIKEERFKDENFDRPENNETIYDGLIAQEIEDTLEDLGIQWSGWTKNESTGKQGVQYGALTVPLIKAVQEQQEIIEGLNKRLEKIERMLVNSNK